MSGKEWTFLAVVLAGVVAVQVMGHGDSDEHDHAGHTHEVKSRREQTRGPGAEEAGQGAFRTVSLEVRGMT